MSLLSVVLPAYNEEAMLPKAASVISGILENATINYELIFVNDGSRDNTWPEIEKCASENPHIHGVCFSRNFGKEAALMAGLSAAKGDCVAVMDCDLQHPPLLLVKMYELWQQGYEVVNAVKSDRGEESALHRFAAKTFYKMMSSATKVDMSRAADYKLMDRKVVDTLLAMPEHDMFFRAASSWVGYKTTEVPFEVQEREAGVSKWSTKSLIKYAVSNIASYTSVPVLVLFWIGVILTLTGLVVGIVDLCIPSNGFAFFYTFLILTVGGVILAGQGVVGYYISKIYAEVQNRPRYIVSKKI